MKVLSKISIFIFLSILLFGCSNKQLYQKKSKIEQKPNILFIAVDDLRPELNFYVANHLEMVQKISEIMDLEHTRSNEFSFTYEK